MRALEVALRLAYKPRMTTDDRARKRLAAPKGSTEPSARLRKRHDVRTRQVDGFPVHTVLPRGRTPPRAVLYRPGPLTQTGDGRAFVGGCCCTPHPVAVGVAETRGGPLSEPVGVQVGKSCPSCGREDPIPLVRGLPGPADFELAERGLVTLGGCMVTPDESTLVCRACGAHWGSNGDDEGSDLRG